MKRFEDQADSVRAKDPTFIIGPGRSGTTLLQTLLCLHEKVAWPSTLTGRLTMLPHLAILSRLNDIDALRRRMQGKKLWIRPTERYTIWDRYIPGFSQNEADATVSPEDRHALRNWCALHVRWQHKVEMVIKYTGHPRLGLIRQVFPDAMFVDIQRDPIEVVLSMRDKNWHGNDIAADDFAALDQHAKLGYYAKRFLAYWAEYSRYASDDYLRVRYEDLVVDVEGTVRLIADHVGLPMSARFRSRLHEIPVHTSKRRGTDEEEEFLSRVLAEPRRILNYKRENSGIASTPTTSATFETRLAESVIGLLRVSMNPEPFALLGCVDVRDPI